MYDRRANRADFRLVVNGVDLSQMLKGEEMLPRDRQRRPRLISLTLTEKRDDEADQLELVIDDSDGRFELPPKRARVELQLGWLAGADVSPGLVNKGSFIVDQVDWGGVPDQLTIRARSADLTAGFRARKERGHRQTTLGAIARDIAKDQGLDAHIDPSLAARPVPVLGQHGQSDMALLRRLGREHDAVATVKQGKLILSPIGRGATPSGKTLPPMTIRRDQVAPGYRYSEIERSADAGVEARWHDTDAGERKTVRTGGKGEGKPRRLKKIYHSEAEAKRAAGAAAGRARRAEASFDLTLALGRPELHPERPTTLAGFKPQIDARKWLIAEISHTMAGEGLSTKLKLETAGTD